jgi:phosphoglycerate dehydrogenase-like enzyme
VKYRDEGLFVSATSGVTLSLLVLGEDPPPSVTRPDPRTKIAIADVSHLTEQLRAADVVFVWDFSSDALRDAWPDDNHPSWVHTASAGVDRMLFPGLVQAATLLTNSRGVFEEPLAEYTLGLVLSMAKDFRGTWELQRQRRWQHRATMRVRGSRAVVVGAGPIGAAIAGTLRAVGVDTALVGRTAKEGVHGGTELYGLLPDADWVICAAPLTESTRGMFDARAFALMSPGARFINIARGPLVVEEDLRDALLEHRLAGAALDVFAHEPLAPDHLLWDTPGLLVSPHMSADTFGWRDDLADLFLDNLRRWRAGQPLRNVVDKHLGYVPVDSPAFPRDPQDPDGPPA